VGDGFADQPLSCHTPLGHNHSHGLVLSFAMVSGLLTIATAAAGHAEPPSNGPVPTVAAKSVDWIQALDPKGLYATFGAGAGWPQPVHYSDDRLGPRLPIRGEVLANPGFASERGLGYDFGRLRGELSWVRRQATIDDAASSWSVGPFRPVVSRDSPKVSSNSGFASLYLDLPVQGTRLIPYVGGGLGFTALQTSPHHDPAAPIQFHLRRQWQPAGLPGQGGAGLSQFAPHGSVRRDRISGLTGPQPGQPGAQRPAQLGVALRPALAFRGAR